MKKVFFALGLLSLALVFSSCSDDDDDKKIAYAELPNTAKDFAVAHFTGESGVSEVKKDNDSYDIYYADYKVEFYIDGEWEGIDGNYKRQNNPVPASVLNLLPVRIIEYVTTHYPQYVIVEVDKERKHSTLVGYEVQLNDPKGTELDFDADGNIISGGNNGDEVIQYSALPDDAKTFLTQHFGGNTGVVSVMKDNDSYDVYYNNYKVEFYISGEWEGVDGNYKGQNNAVPSSVIDLIPAAIKTYVTTQYPGNDIVEVDKEKTNNTLVGYEVQIDDVAKTELDFDANGNFLRVD
ncbi:PepSY-like domain-containing protein [Dysgonomonas sp. 25]|uniref:PepSY-like domain-containing protein n=1 Tax=Dysgonomonas sp. 25 TaxID=2302933 RepID=UPI0013CFFE9E|nr:PepSY-like domain-containing protein [Dysgonomonas sp. 25]NDV70357.1 hypothetical protein [Dysgonomonas sp. 25]